MDILRKLVHYNDTLKELVWVDSIVTGAFKNVSSVSKYIFTYITIFYLIFHMYLINWIGSRSSRRPKKKLKACY